MDFALVRLPVAGPQLRFVSKIEVKVPVAVVPEDHGKEPGGFLFKPRVGFFNEGAETPSRHADVVLDVAA